MSRPHAFNSNRLLIKESMVGCVNKADDMYKRKFFIRETSEREDVCYLKVSWKGKTARQYPTLNIYIQSVSSRIDASVQRLFSCKYIQRVLINFLSGGSFSRLTYSNSFPESQVFPNLLCCRRYKVYYLLNTVEICI